MTAALDPSRPLPAGQTLRGNPTIRNHHASFSAHALRTRSRWRSSQTLWQLAGQAAGAQNLPHDAYCKGARAWIRPGPAPPLPRHTPVEHRSLCRIVVECSGVGYHLSVVALPNAGAEDQLRWTDVRARNAVRATVFRRSREGVYRAGLQILGWPEDPEEQGVRVERQDFLLVAQRHGVHGALAAMIARMIGPYPMPHTRVVILPYSS